MIGLHKEIDSMEDNMKTTYENNATPKPKKYNILTFLLCLLISLIIWIYIANVDIIRDPNNNPQDDTHENVETT